MSATVADASPTPRAAQCAASCSLIVLVGLAPVVASYAIYYLLAARRGR